MCCYPQENSGHANSLEMGEEFQDFVMHRLYKEGIIIQNYSSKQYQHKHGENIQRIEIKLDNRCFQTGQLSIELSEKKDKDDQVWTPSGIYNGHSIFYIQGNEQKFYLFSTSLLRLLHLSDRYIEHEVPTVKKFYLPILEAERYCINSYSQ